jgi:hypothetical protein
MKFAIRYLLAMLLVLGGHVYAADCRLESSTCVDSTASKTISGVVVTLADVGGCWEYQDTYTCIKPNSIDYCSALTAAGCGQTSSVCSDTAFNGTCNTYTKTFRCGNNQGTPTNTVRLDNTLFTGHGYGEYQPVQQLCAKLSLPPGVAFLRGFHPLQARFQWGDRLLGRCHTACGRTEFHGNLLELPGRLLLHRRKPCRLLFRHQGDARVRLGQLDLRQHGV